MGNFGPNVKEVDSANFDAEVLQASDPVLVDLSAEWCGPCRALAPVIQELANEYEGKVKFANLDIDKSPDITNKYNVNGVPTLLLFKGGNVVGQLTGAHPRARIVDLINEAG